MKYIPLLLVLSAVVFSACNPFSQPTPSPVVTPTPTPQATNEPQQPEDQVSLQQPLENSTVSSPFEIEGSAPGTWFFEGQIIGEVRNANNEVLATFPLQAKGEWMTEDQVEFTGEATFLATEAGSEIQLVIRNDNPSGLPENDKYVSFPLKVAQ